jgi:hypothetical protein
MMLENKVIGTWKLVPFSVECGKRTKTVYPLGKDAGGFIIYTPDGYMSSQVLRRGREDYNLFADDGTDLERAASAARGYLS